MLKKSRIILFSVIVLSFLMIALTIYSAAPKDERPLEVTLPNIPGITTPTMIGTPIIVYLNYVYTLAIVVAGFLVFLIFMIGGFRYITSTGNPSKLTDSKKQMFSALLGLVLVLGAYLILNTIDPKLVALPKLIIPEMKETDSSGVLDTKLILNPRFYELPLATLITTEYGASLFFDDTTSTDPSATDAVAYLNAFPKEESYPANFQGALHGRRLKRIWETATSSMNMAELINTIAYEAQLSVNYLVDKLASLVGFANNNCTCSACSGPPCPGNHSCGCSACTSCNGGDSCSLAGIRNLMEDLRTEIPTLYKDDASLIPCKFLELEYATNAFIYFLTAPQELVKNEDYKALSYYYSEEASTTRAKIEKCQNKEIEINNGQDKLLIKRRYDDIENAIKILATTENKGNWDPTSTIPERDVKSNLDDLKTIYNAILSVKKSMNPYSGLMGSYDFLTYHQFLLFQTETQWTETTQGSTDKKNKTIVYPYKITFSSVSGSTGRAYTKEIEIQTSIDPAVFYTGAMPEFEAVNPSPEEESNPRFKFPGGWEILKNFIKKLLPEVALAEDDTNPDDLGVETGQEAEETIDETKSACTKLVEIPIGKATDEALKLIQLIINNLKEIVESGQGLLQQVMNFKDISEELRTPSDRILELTAQGQCDCGKATTCEHKCETHYYDCNCDPDTGICETCCSCKCLCLGKQSTCNVQALNDAFATAYNDYKDFVEKIKGINESYETIKKAALELSTNDYNKKVPEEPNKKYFKDYPIGSDTCCMEHAKMQIGSIEVETGSVPQYSDILTGNCRNNGKTNPLRGGIQNTLAGNIEKHDYLFMEKIAEVQKLLNMSREIKHIKTDDFDKKKMFDSVYGLLLTELNNKKLVGNNCSDEGGPCMVTDKEKSFFKNSGGAGLDLTNCNSLYKEVVESLNYERKSPERTPMNSIMATGELDGYEYQIIDIYDPEKCTPDPLLDCYYFNYGYQKKDTVEGVLKDRNYTRARSPYSCYIYRDEPIEWNYAGYSATSKIYMPEGGLANDMFCCEQSGALPQ